MLFTDLRDVGAHVRRALVCALLIAVLSQTVVAFAQTEEPMPTMVPLVIPINPLMTSTNDWMATLAPIAAIGIGMTLALAVFAFLAKTIKSAFS